MRNDFINPAFYRLLGRIAASNLNFSNTYKLSVSLTGRCNLSCAYCNIPQKSGGIDLSAESIKCICRNNPSLSWVDCTGGEIFVRDDIEKILYLICRYTKNLVYLHFPTNGLLTDRICETAAFISRRFPKIKIVATVSLDGPSDIHNALRGNNAFDKAVKTLLRLRKIGIESYAGFTYGVKNKKALIPMIEYFRSSGIDLGWDDIHVNIALPSEIYYRNDEVIEYTAGIENSRFLNFVRKRKNLSACPTSFLETIFLKLASGYYKTSRRSISCTAGRDSLFIREDGQIFPCIIKNHSYGNIADHGFIFPAMQDYSHCNDCFTPCEAYISIISKFYSALLSAL